MSWPGPRGLPYHAHNGRTAATAWSPATLPQSRHRQGEPEAPAPHKDHGESLSSSVRGPAAARTRDEVLVALVAEARTIKRARADGWRRLCEIVHQIKSQALWEGRGFETFDAWAWATLKLDRDTVSRLLAIGYGAIGGERRRGPGGGPGRPAQQEVEKQLSASQPPVVGIPHVVGDPNSVVPPDVLGWLERTVGNFERVGPAGVVAGLPDATDWPRLLRRLAQLEDALRTCRELARARARAAARNRP